MAKFVLENELSDVVTFSTRIDGDGDFVVTANGVDILWISPQNGVVERFYCKTDAIEALSEVGFSITNDQIDVV